MEKGKKYIAIILMILLTICMFGCGSKDKAETEKVKENKIPVEVKKVRKGVFTKAIVLSGITKPQSQVTVLPKLMGAEKIISLNADVGDRVKKGQTIAVLDQGNISIQLEQAQIAYDNALKNYERNKVLHEMGAVSQAAFEQIETAFQQAQNNLELQKIAYNNTIVKSPINGIVTQVHIEEGALASAQTPIITVVNIDTLEINTSINEMQVNKLSVGEKVEVLVPALGEKIFEGKIKSISPAMDERIKAYPLVISLENKENKIKAGMYAEIEVVTDIHPESLIVPSEAVITRDGFSKVFIVKEGKAELREVVTGLSNGNETEILEGINEGDQVITWGNEDVVKGDKVIVVKRGDK